MECAEAQKTVMLSIADAQKMEEARIHVRTCISCTGSNYLGSIDNLANAINRRADRSSIGRWVLATLGAIQLVLALPWLFGSSPFWSTASGTDTSHLSRDGAIGIVFGLVAISVACSPRLAVFALPITFIMLLLQTVTGIFDNAQENVHASFEVVHIIGALISIGIAVLARPKRVKKSTQRSLTAV
jgi:hypothetical protein